MDDPAKWWTDHAAELQLSLAEKQRVRKIDHLVAHITYERLREDSDFGPLDHQLVLKRLCIFHDSLPAEHKPHFPALAALLGQVLARPLAPRH
jgi:hypothetical protein